MSLGNRKQAQALKEAIFRTFNELQEDGQPYSLLAWAKQNPKEFYTGLLPRVIPKPLELSGSEEVSFAIVYQVGDQKLIIGQDGKLLPLGDGGISLDSRDPEEEIVDITGI